MQVNDRRPAPGWRKKGSPRTIKETEKKIGAKSPVEKPASIKIPAVAPHPKTDLAMNEVFWL